MEKPIFKSIDEKLSFTTMHADPNVQGNCVMHMMFASLTYALKPLEMASPLYCSSLLLRKQHTMKARGTTTCHII